MPNELQDIRTFPQLVAYLRDEMHWPISGDHFEKLTFDFTPEELGIDMKNAAKVKEIKQLRPFSANQPWGIFFVNFEPKQLPVVALRRILGSLALKQRASANESDRKAWSQDDLLFVSNYGEGEERKICLAHFAQSDKKKDLPVLKVLGWDNLDTPLHLDHVAGVLTEKLTWPSDGDDVDYWRSQWRSAFTLEHRETIKTSKQLAVALAELARNIRDRINTVLRIESEDGRITKLMSAFKEALVDDLDEDGFADMYAQTIAYGLLSARIANPKGDTADGVAAAMPVTNPFLKELLETFLHTGGRDTKNKKGIRLDFDELGVGDVVELLDAANMEEVVLDFGDKNPQEDPVIHFYELFLKEYDPKMRMARGVFYTPRPVVSFIVRSVDELLRTEFDLEDGLADTTTWREMCKRIKNLEIPDGATPEQVFVQILDPATGTGTFLVEVIDLIHKTMTEKWKAAGHGKKKIIELWNEYVPEHLLPRLHGYELMMAPYAIAHMKIGLKLYETGYRFESDERARVYLTNALEPAQDFSGTLAFAIPALAHEAEAVSTIKRDQRFTVVIGNPPYSISSLNTGQWITSLTETYKVAVRNERNIQPLSDDYVKFFRMGQNAIEMSKEGILAYISNHTFFSGLIHRGMRKELRDTFNTFYAVDLNGSTLLGLDILEDGQKDQNVFDIQQGVGITIGSTSPKVERERVESQVQFLSVKSPRNSKYAFLSINTAKGVKSEPILLYQPNYFFAPMAEPDRFYDSWPSLDEVFLNKSAGFETGRDKALISFDYLQIKKFCENLHAKSFSEAQLSTIYKIKDTNGWPVTRRRDKIQSKPIKDLISSIQSVDYRPFDSRFTIYCSFLRRAQYENMRHMLSPNLGLITTRIIKGEQPSHFFITRNPIDRVLLSPTTSTTAFLFPLYIVRDENNCTTSLLGAEEPEVNFRRSFLTRFSNAIGSPTSIETGLPVGFEAEDIFNFIYAVFHSCRYRAEYADFLKIGFPRLPLPGAVDLFTKLAQFGTELISLHLTEKKVQDVYTASLLGSGKFQVEKVSYSDETVWIDKDKTRGFKGVPEEVWNFHIGGYQVCEKWLKDRQAKGGKNPRPGRVLTDEDIEHYQKIVVALSETIRIMGEIDEVIEEHGGWPGAFVTNTESEE